MVAALLRLALSQQAQRVSCRATLDALGQVSRHRAHLLPMHRVVLGYLAAACGAPCGGRCCCAASTATH